MSHNFGDLDAKNLFKEIVDRINSIGDQNESYNSDNSLK